MIIQCASGMFGYITCKMCDVKGVILFIQRFNCFIVAFHNLFAIYFAIEIF